jgi:hypothetical protein
MPSANARILPKRLADAYFTGSFKFLLVSAAPSEANLDAWDFRNDVTNEVTGTGYTAGGVPVTVTVGAVDTANNRVAITISNLSPGWTTATINAVGGWLYKNVGTAATDDLIAFVDFGSAVVSTASDFSVTFSAPIYIATA